MRKAIFWVHLCVGVLAGIVILIMSVTGVLLTYQRQITSWADPVFVAAPSPSSRLTLAELCEEVAANEPQTPTTITISSEPSVAAVFSFGRDKTLFINPYTGAIIGEGSRRVRAFFQSVTEWHRWLGQAGENRAVGKAITGACNVAFLFLIVTGIYLWIPRKWNLRALKSFAIVDLSATGKSRDWNWHNVVGIWSAIPLGVVVFTAIFFSYPAATAWLYRATGEQPPSRPGPGGGSRMAKSGRPESREEATQRKPDASMAPALHAAWAQAIDQFPAWRTITVRLPSSAEMPVSLTIDRGNGARPDLRDQFSFHPKTGEGKWESYKSEGVARKIRLWVRWLHTGEAGGWLGQSVAGAASAGGVLLVWTGLSLAIRRFFKRKATRSSAIPDIVSTI